MFLACMQQPLPTRSRSNARGPDTEHRFLSTPMRLLPAFVFVLILISGFATSAIAQEEGLARDFEKLSAKERARIAKEEHEAAQVDAAFQTVMALAEDLFRQVKYEESMAKFKEARTMRPYNVYPKVKIQDLQALIAKRDAAAAEAAPEPGPVVQNAPSVTTGPIAPIAVEPAMPDKPVPVASGRLVISATVREPATEMVRTPRLLRVEETRKGVPGEQGSLPDRAKPTVAVPPSQVPALVEGQRVYKEGRSVVVENTIGREGHLVTFRKVSHPWGEVNFFRDGVSISARGYQQAMEGR